MATLEELLRGTKKERLVSPQPQPQVQQPTELQFRTPQADRFQEQVREAQVAAARPKTQEQLRFDEDAFRLSGALIGGTIGDAWQQNSLTTLAGAGLGQELGGQTARLLNLLLSEDQQFLPENLETGLIDVRDKSAEASINISTDMMLGGLFSRVGKAVGSLPRRVFGEETNRLAKVSTKKLGELFGAKQVPKSAGIFGGPIVKGSEIGLSKLPTSAQIVQSSIDDTLRGIGKVGDEAIELAGARKSTEAIGAGLKRNITSWVDLTRGEINRKFAAVGQKISGDAVVNMRNTTTAIDDLTGATSDIAAIRRIQFPPEIKNILSAINKEIKGVKQSGQLSWSDASKLMSGIGNKIGDPNVNIKTPKQMLKKIHAAILTDMEEKAIKLGPDAKQAWESARSFTRNFHQKKQIVSGIANSGLGRDAFESAISKAKRTPEVLRELKTIVSGIDRKNGSKVWNDFVSTYLFEFSREPVSQRGAEAVADFSVNQFLKNYNALKGSGSDKILFSGIPGLQESLNTLQKISAASKDVSRFANPSGTASQNQFMNVLTGRILLGAGGAAAGTEFSEDPGRGALFGAGTALIAPWAFGRLITNKRFVNWLAQGTRIAPADVNGISAHLGRLVGITKVAPEIRDAVEDYLNTFKAQQETGRKDLTGVSNIPFIPQR
jgi:hypothetical protein